MTTRGNDEFKEKILHEPVWAIEVIMQQKMKNLMLPSRVKRNVVKKWVNL